jgi:hypothetical protein
MGCTRLTGPGLALAVAAAAFTGTAARSAPADGDEGMQLAEPALSSSGPGGPPPGLSPGFLGRPLDTAPARAQDLPAAETSVPLLLTHRDPPLGFAGPSGVLPSETQQSSHFVPIEDRWRVGFPEWDRYGLGHPFGQDYPYEEGHWYDPYNLNVLKGDYPIIGQHTFLDITASSISFIEARQVPTGTTPFESTARPFEEQFFGRPNQLFFTNYFQVSFDLFHGDAAFKPVDWRLKVTPVFDANYLDVNELAVVNPNVLEGSTRGRSFFTLEEYFAEAKITDLSPDYDFLSVRVGSQPFVSDFRGFLFSDVNRGVRLFGSADANRQQFNLVYFRQAEKDTNSELNTFRDRGQEIVIANYFYQDFIWPGYTAQVSIHYNHDPKSFQFDKNDTLVRPDPVGVFQPHELNVAYLGWAGDGHINRFNITHQLYWALGRDSLNPLANTPQDINAQMFALELSYDRDWMRFRTSVLWASGDKDPNNGHATGFDSIQDNPNFAGGEFSYWQRQAIRLFGVNLVNRESLLADLRSSKIQGQSNFVNPGLELLNFGVDLDLTPKLKMINNVNFLWFDETRVLEQFTFDGNIHHAIGTDLSTGFEYRPFLNNNTIVVLGLSALIPGEGFRDLYDNVTSAVPTMVAGFLKLNLTF